MQRAPSNRFRADRRALTRVYARGPVSDLYQRGPDREAFSIGERFNVSPPETDFRISGFASVLASNEAVFLVRPVPIPGAIWLPGPGLLALFTRASARS